MLDHQLLVPWPQILDFDWRKVIVNMSGVGGHADKRIAVTVTCLLWCPRSMVHRAHGRGRIVLTTENTTINHNDNVAREGNAVVQLACEEVAWHHHPWHFEGLRRRGCCGGFHEQHHASWPWKGTHCVDDKAHNNQPWRWHCEGGERVGETGGVVGGRWYAAADGDNARDVHILTAARDLTGSVCPWEGTNRRVKNNTSTNHDNYVPRERNVALRGQRMGANGGDCIAETM